MGFLEDVLEKEYLELDENNVRLRVVGRTELLPETTRRILDDKIGKLSGNDGLVLTLAVSYGGRAEIVDAARRILAREPSLRPEEITEESFRDYLYDPSLPDPDLLIRTSGEQRISNFMLWQVAYSEILVTDVLWPDFSETNLIGAIEDYQRRERRYGLST
jgi:undecaprenyl diphosphate synthase